MNSTPENKRFWLSLLDYPSNPSERTRIWNAYVMSKLPGELQHRIRNFGSPPLNEFENNARLGLKAMEVLQLEDFAQEHGGHPEFTFGKDGRLTGYMNFSDHTFSEEVCFAGRILVGATFCRTRFNKLADFRDVVFANVTDFEGVLFANRSRFDDAAFENTVYFRRAAFMETTVFDRSTFKVAAYFDYSKFLPIQGPKGSLFGGVGFRNSNFTEEVQFQGATFGVRTHFEGAKLKGRADFTAARFEEYAEFQRAEFDNMTNFSSAKFRKEVRFHDAIFRSTTDFHNAEFLQPPKFFGTDLHEDTSFHGISWRRAERCYAASWWSRMSSIWSKVASRSSEQNTGSDTVDAGSAIQAWDRLALMMSKLEKLPERHEFYRLRMRAQRRRDGLGVLALMNWLFDVLCDYGWSVRRALFWWFLHLVGVGLFIFTHANHSDSNIVRVLLDSLAVSFSNAHVFFGLTSKGGYLYEARQRLAGLIEDASVLSILGTIQTVVGPILLFLLLLTLRNRFRLR